MTRARRRAKPPWPPEQGVPFGVSAAISALHAQAAERFKGADGELLAIAELEARAGHKLRSRNRQPDGDR